jgi:hypothetical protein
LSTSGLLDLAGGTLSVASGQTFVFPNTYAQSVGLTDIAAGGILQGAPTLTGIAESCAASGSAAAGEPHAIATASVE